MIYLPADTLNDHVQLTEFTNTSLTLEAVGQGAARQQSVSGVDAAVRRKVGVHVAFEVLVILSDMSHPLSDSLINYAQPRELDSSAFTSLPGPSK